MSSLLKYSEFADSEFDSPEVYQTHGTVTQKILPKEYEEVKAALAYLAVLEDNWNGYASKAPTEGSIDATLAFFKSFYLNRPYPNNIAPDGDGAIMLIWLTDNSKIVITVEPGLLHPAIEYVDGRNEFPMAIPYDLGTIPAEILKIIPERRPNAATPAR